MKLKAKKLKKTADAITNNNDEYPINSKSNRPNLYQYFIEFADSVLKEDGLLTFINPNQFLSTDNGFELRKFLIEKRSIQFFVDVSYIPIFKEASTYTVIWQYRKAFNKNCKIRINRCQNLSELTYATFYIDSSLLLQSENKIIPLSLDFFILDKIEKSKKKLKDIASLKWGTSASGYGKKKIKEEIFNKLTETEKLLYHPIIQTSDIKTYKIEWQKEYIPINIFSEAIRQNFLKPKIVVARLTKNIQACIDNSQYYVGKSTLIFDSSIDLRILLAIINSAFINKWYFLKYESTHMAGGYIRYDVPYLEEIPIPDINENFSTKICSLVDEILLRSSQSSDVSKLRNVLDNIIFNLYGLTETDIKSIAPEFNLYE